MADSENNPSTSQPRSSARMPETMWSVVLRAKNNSTASTDEALAKLCQIYWRPLSEIARGAMGIVYRARQPKLILRPANPGVARTQMPGGSAPAQQGQPLALIFDDITQMFTHQRGILQIAMGGDFAISANEFLVANQAHCQVIQNLLLLGIRQSNGRRHAEKNHNQGGLSTSSSIR
jgi:hypothetical protein